MLDHFEVGKMYFCRDYKTLWDYGELSDVLSKRVGAIFGIPFLLLEVRMRPSGNAACLRVLTSDGQTGWISDFIPSLKYIQPLVRD